MELSKEHEELIAMIIERPELCEMLLPLAEALLHGRIPKEELYAVCHQ